MPQPAEVDAIAEELISLYRQAQESLNVQLAEIATAPNQGRRRARLRDLSRQVEATLDQLEADSRRWLEQRFPKTYEVGATNAAAQLGEAWVWSQPHLDAVRVLATSTYAEVLSATGFVRDEAKRWVREQARAGVARSLVEGETPTQVARRFVADAAGEVADMLGGPVGMVRYADGSYRRIGDYGDMLFRTAVANAHNAGSLNQYQAMGVTHVVVLDGTGCGWTGHDSGDAANGSVRTLADAQAHPLSHPRCRRAFSAAPQGVRNARQAREAGLLPTETQQANQSAVERERTEVLTRRRRARQPRTGRTPRAARSGTGSTR